MKPAICLLCLALAGCGTVPPEVRTVTNTVQVPVACEAPRPSKPSWAVDALPLDAEIDEQMRALRADRQRAKGYISELEASLGACKD